MKRVASFTKLATGALAAAAALYLFAAVGVDPDRPGLLYLREARREIDRLWERLEKKPLIYPSRREAVKNCVAGGGSGLEGFAAVSDFSCFVDHIQSYTWPIVSRKVRTWIVRNNRPGEAVSWFTATCPASRTTTFVFSGALGVVSGEAELLISGEPALTFDTGREDRPGAWKSGGVRLSFFPLRRFVHESGIFCLTVPAEMITAGKPLLIGVRSKSGRRDHSFFALHDHRDTWRIVAED